MKKIILSTLLITMGFIPALALAHTGETDSTDSMPMMGTESSGDITHEEFEEMEDVMIKMMNGEELSSEEWQEMSEFMEDHHGSYMPMMGIRGGFDQMPFNGGNYNATRGMMWGNHAGGTFFSWMFVATTIVWLLVGVLLAIYLVRKLNK